jgi:hypothetical protein
MQDSETPKIESEAARMAREQKMRQEQGYCEKLGLIDRLLSELNIGA